VSSLESIAEVGAVDHSLVSQSSGVRTDRRLTPRVAAQVPVLLHCRGLSGPLPARTIDIGSGGACVETGALLELGSIRGVTIDLPWGPVQLQAEGCWQRETPQGQQSGLRFIEPDSRSSDSLRDFVHNRAAELARFLERRTKLTGLGLDEALDLALFTRAREFPAGYWIYRQDTIGQGKDSIFFVYNGSVVLDAQMGGAPSIRVGRIAIGGIFGGLPLLAATPHVASAIAETPLIVLEIDSHTFEYLRDAKPWVARHLETAIVRDQALHMRTLIEKLTRR